LAELQSEGYASTMPTESARRRANVQCNVQQEMPKKPKADLIKINSRTAASRMGVTPGNTGAYQIAVAQTDMAQGR
jgi:hypothetical protein